MVRQQQRATVTVAQFRRLAGQHRVSAAVPEWMREARVGSTATTGATSIAVRAKRVTDMARPSWGLCSLRTTSQRAAFQQQTGGVQSPRHNDHQFGDVFIIGASDRNVNRFYRIFWRDEFVLTQLAALQSLAKQKRAPPIWRSPCRYHSLPQQRSQSIP